MKDFSICPTCAGPRTQQYLSGRKNGWICDGCQCAAVKRRYWADLEQSRKRVRARYWADPEKSRAKGREERNNRSRERGRINYKAYCEANPEKVAARSAVNSAIRAGELIREPCAVCGNQRSEAHHHKGYEQEYWLDVVFLCSVHHAEADTSCPPPIL